METIIRRLFLLSCTLILLVCFLLYTAETAVMKINLSPESGVQSNEKLVYYIENIELIQKPFYQGGGELFLRGWIVLPDTPVSTISYAVMLQPEGSDIALSLPIKLVERSDVQELYRAGTPKCGFVARVKLSKLTLESDRYEIVLGYQCNGKNDIVATAQTIGGDLA